MTATALISDQETRDRAEMHARGIVQRLLVTGHYRPMNADRTTVEWVQHLSKRLKWDAFAAHEYAGPILQDAWEIEQTFPELGPDAFHLAAGAACMCACMTPAAHRDGLEQLAARLMALTESCPACTANPGEPCREWCLSRTD